MLPTRTAVGTDWHSDPFADEESLWLKPARGKIKWIVFDYALTPSLSQREREMVNIVFQEPAEQVKA